MAASSILFLPFYAFRLLLRLPPLLSLLILLGLSAQSFYISLQLTKLVLRLYANLLRNRNKPNRARLLQLIGINEASSQKRLLIGFFHPYCNAGGGGERVLWTAIALHQRTRPDAVCAVFTGDLGVPKTEMIQKVEQRFGIPLDPSTIILVPLASRRLVESATWPRCTLLGQSLGSILLGHEALSRLIPDIYIDTMGYAFTFPVFRLLTSAPIGAYVHYPTISTDMLARVSQRRSAHNNSDAISNSMILSYAKLLYYMLFAEAYAICLRQADYLMANSSWTKAHIDRLLKRDEPDDEPAPSIDLGPSEAPADGLRHGVRVPTVPSLVSQSPKARKAKVVYPPCDVQSFVDFPLTPREMTVLSIAQFRPEKDHLTQLEAFAQFLSPLPAKQRSQYKLVLAGSCRGEPDEQRVRELKEASKLRGIADAVDFKVNINWAELRRLLGEASVGLSTMVDEHFGISVVEFMAAGLVPLVHRSGGPLLDIVVPYQAHTTGFHANGAEEYAARLKEIFELSGEELLRVRTNARRAAVEKFSVEEFERGWTDGFRILETNLMPS